MINYKKRIIYLLILFTFFSAGSVFSQNRYQKLALFSRTLKDIFEKYVKDVKLEEVTEGTIHDMLRALDPYSQYFTPAEYESFNAAYSGEEAARPQFILGADSRYWTVISSKQGSDAGKQGILPGDRIYEINGESVLMNDRFSIYEQLKGKAGSKIKVSFLRTVENNEAPADEVHNNMETNTIELELVRETDSLNPVTHKIIKDKIGYLKIAGFDGEAADKVDAALKEMNGTITGLVLDLRDNAGGAYFGSPLTQDELTDTVVRISEQFLAPGKLVTTLKLQEGTMPYSTVNSVANDFPVIILVNRGTAQAAEVLAGALQSWNRGLIIGPKGERTFGKAIHQEKFALLQGGALLLSTGKFLTPRGDEINIDGLEPDIKIPLTTEQKLAIQVEEKTGYLAETKLINPMAEKPKKQKTDGEKEEVYDIMLARACDVLKAAGIFAFNSTPEAVTK